MRAVLLSDKELAAELKERYVLSWESVREVPKATIDFGNGEVLTRTLKGNCVFYVCEPDGRVRDILPGVYTPDDFRQELRASEPLAQAAPEDNLAMIGKAVVESPILSSFALVDSKEKISEMGVRDISSEPHTRAELQASTTRDLTLRNDSRASVQVLRPAAKRFLSGQPAQNLKNPSLLTRALYLEVLGIDLGDPYLGLRERDIPGVD
ncbi:MAG: hypothetical protein KC800_01655 [Candidatus Eremiobacteraeota bacterium]|nr:hypothetical protein [Candidatus Eremiobacteraeota bacterium]